VDNFSLESESFILDLKFGCEVLSSSTKFQFIHGNRVDYVIYNENFGPSGPSTIIDKILGRPIRLADCLHAIEVNLRAGKEMIAAMDNLVHLYWFLENDNLDNQSEETKTFLIRKLVPSS
jgi:hypothetical protein